MKIAVMAGLPAKRYMNVYARQLILGFRLTGHLRCLKAFPFFSVLFVSAFAFRKNFYAPSFTHLS